MASLAPFLIHRGAVCHVCSRIPLDLVALTGIGNVLRELGLSKEAAAMYHRAHRAESDRPEHRIALDDMMVRHRLLFDAAAFYANRHLVAHPPLVGSI